jgi:hypothetical protein
LNCLHKIFTERGVCVIDNAVKTIQKKNGKCGIGNRGKTKIVVKEHFSEKGKTMEEENRLSYIPRWKRAEA